MNSINLTTRQKNKIVSRKYKKLKTCQLPGCNNPLLKTSKNKRNKYCCNRHANMAKKLYKKLWRDKNKDKIKISNTKYLIKTHDYKDLKSGKF